MTRAAIRILLLGLASLSGCLTPDLGTAVDLEPPAVEYVSMGTLAPPAPPSVARAAELRIRFTEALDPWTVGADTVMVVAGAPGGDCLESSDCDEGRCVGGLCVAATVDQAFRKDANRPPLTQGRAALVHPATVSLTADAREVRLVPERPFSAPMGYTLVLSGALRDRTGNPLGEVEGRWQGFVYDFVVLRDGTGPPAGGLIQPEPEAEAVPPNLPVLQVGFDRPVSGVTPGGLWLRPVGGAGLGGAAVSGTAEPLDEGCPAARSCCYRFFPKTPLQPDTRYVLKWSEAVRDPWDQPVAGSGASGFTTAATADTRPPAVSAPRLEADGGCVTAVFQTDEPTRARVALWQAGQEVFCAELPQWSTSHQAQVPASGAAGTLSLLLEAWDAVGLRGSWGPEPLPAELPPAVAISEVLANPAGPEPRQEFVEILNLGATAVELEGWWITDDPGRQGDPLPPVSLAPGAVGLVVPSGYDPQGGADPAPAPAAVLISLQSGTLGSGGLSNSGEPVLLLTPQGQVASAYGGQPDSGATPANGQSVRRSLGGGCAERGPWELHPDGTSSPGRVP